MSTIQIVILVIVIIILILEVYRCVFCKCGNGRQSGGAGGPGNGNNVGSLRANDPWMQTFILPDPYRTGSNGVDTAIRSALNTAHDCLLDRHHQIYMVDRVTASGMRSATDSLRYCRLELSTGKIWYWDENGQRSVICNVAPVANPDNIDDLVPLVRRPAQVG